MFKKVAVALAIVLAGAGMGIAYAGGGTTYTSLLKVSVQCKTTTANGHRVSNVTVKGQNATTHSVVYSVRLTQNGGTTTPQFKVPAGSSRSQTYPFYDTGRLSLWVSAPGMAPVSASLPIWCQSIGLT